MLRCWSGFAVAIAVEQLDFSAVIRTLPFLGYDDDKLDALGGHIGFADSVTVEQLAVAGVPYRTVFHLRRRLDPRAAAAEVRGSSGLYYVSFVVVLVESCAFTFARVLLSLSHSRVQWTGGTTATCR